MFAGRFISDNSAVFKDGPDTCIEQDALVSNYIKCLEETLETHPPEAMIYRDVVVSLIFGIHWEDV